MHSRSIQRLREELSFWIVWLVWLSKACCYVKKMCVLYWNVGFVGFPLKCRISILFYNGGYLCTKVHGCHQTLHGLVILYLTDFMQLLQALDTWCWESVYKCVINRLWQHVGEAVPVSWIFLKDVSSQLTAVQYIKSDMWTCNSPLAHWLQETF